MPDMAVNDFFVGEIAIELIKMLIIITRKACFCKTRAQELIATIQELLPIIEEIKYSGVELPPTRQRQLDTLSESLRNGRDLTAKVLASSRWNVYKNLQLAKKMEKLQKSISRFVKGPMHAHVLADVHHLRFESAERFDRLDLSARRLEQQLGSMKIGVSDQDGLMEEAMQRVEEEEIWCEGNLVTSGVGFELGKKKLKEIVIGKDDSSVIGICGIGGSGKTTLAREICRDDDVRSHFNNRIFFLTVSQSPNIEQLRQKIWGMISGNANYTDVAPKWTLQYSWSTVTRTLIILDDVWSLGVLEQLIFKIPGCKTLVVSRSKFPASVINSTYDLELLKEDEAMSLFCHSAFGQTFIPRGTDKKLVEQIVEKCKGLPLALKVIGASLRDQPEMLWISAKNGLSKGQPISESHEIQLLERMKLSVDYLHEKVRECFLDLGSFPEDKKIPLDILINVWVELHGIEKDEAFAILFELSDKNLIRLVKDARAGDMYSSYYEISVCQHDVLRDLAIYLSNRDNVNQRKRLVMSRRESGVPRGWESSNDQPFNAQIVSVHTGEMEEMDWPSLEFPKAEVLILNFSSTKYVLPPFVESMPKLRALIVINYGTKNAVLHNLSVFTNLSNLRSLWFEKVSVPSLPETTLPLKNLRKISLILCSMKTNSLDKTLLDSPNLFPRLSELTMDHCINMTQLPSSICKMKSLENLSVTNCDSLEELPSDLGNLILLQILRVYACPNLKNIPNGIGGMIWLKYIDISQCVNMENLPEGIVGCHNMEKIDMRECPKIKKLPNSTTSMRSLRKVICDEDISLQWKFLEDHMPHLCVQVAQQFFDLDWLVD